MKKLALLYLVSTTLYAEANPAGIGLVAENMMEPVRVFSDFIYTACLVIGVSFLFASIVKYFEHKRSPLMVPISTVIFLLLTGFLLVCLPFLGNYAQYGVPYTFLKSTA